MSPSVPGWSVSRPRHWPAAPPIRRPERNRLGTARGHGSDVAAWVRLLAWLTGIIAAIEVIFLGLIATLVPPLAAGVVLTIIGLVVLRRAQGAGIAVLGITTLPTG